jgi:hypothetical protein
MCPIGAMNKIFATLAMTEVRTFKTNCEGCTDPTCYKGDSPMLDPSDAYAVKGCTMDLKNNQLRDMGDVRPLCSGFTWISSTITHALFSHSPFTTVRHVHELCQEL